MNDLKTCRRWLWAATIMLYVQGIFQVLAWFQVARPWEW
jgi:hypothetical protein